MIQMAKNHEWSKILAKDHCDPDGDLVRSGTVLADAVISAVSTGVDVEISFDGMKGLSSSYFNVFLSRVLGVLDPEAFDRRIRLTFATTPQREVFDRSRKAVLAGPRDP